MKTHYNSSMPANANAARYERAGAGAARSRNNQAGITDLDKSFLSKFSRIKQDKAAELKQKDEDETKFAIDMIMLETKNPDIDGEGGGGSGGSSIAMLNLTASNGRRLSIMSDSLSELVERGERKALVDNFDLKGHIVEIDDSVRQFYGDSTIFDYEIKRHSSLNTAQKYESAHVKIRIINEDGKTVYTKLTSSDKQNNSFKWNGELTSAQGKIISSKIAPDGRYKIEVEAWLGSSSGKKIPLQTSTTLEKKIDDVERDDNDQVKWNIGGKKMSPTDTRIRKISSKAHENVPKDLMPYIGKKGKLNLQQVNVSSGVGVANYFNTVKNPGKATISLYCNGKLDRVVEYNKKIEQGLSHLKFSNLKDQPRILDGNYTCTIEVEDKDNDNQLVELPTSQEVVIDAVDFETGDLLSNGQKFNPDMISEIRTIPVQDNSLLTQSGFYVGKRIGYEDNIIKFEGSFNKQFPLAKLSLDASYGDGLVQIFDLQEKLVAEVKIPASEMKINNVPTYDELDNQSKQSANVFIAQLESNSDGTNVIYKDLSSEDKVKVNDHVKDEFLNGKYFSIGQNHDDLTIQRNKGMQNFNWDGELLNGKVAQINDVYTYQILQTLNDLSGAKQYVNENLKFGTVTHTVVEDGQIFLILDDNNAKKISDIKSIV